MTAVTSEWYAHQRDLGWTCHGPSPDAVAFHRGLPDDAPTPLIDVPSLARELEVAAVLVKDESSRLGLPAFKALGASWALHRVLREVSDGATSAAAQSVSRRPVVAATDGNHGRAVARFARRLGHPARIFLPDGVSDGAAQAIRDEGAEVVLVGGSYDHAVATAARAAEVDGAVLVQDTSWDGYTDVPGWIVEGYATLFVEIDEQLRVDDRRVDAVARPDLVVVPVGVGSLLQAALAHYRRAGAAAGTAVLAVEALAAACLAASLTAGHPVTVATGRTVMAGLNCGTPSTLAWPYIAKGLDAVAAVTDSDAIEAARDLAALGIPAGPCGAASLAAARVALTGPSCDSRRAHLGIGPDSTLVLVSTEGVEANPLPNRLFDGTGHHD